MSNMFSGKSNKQIPQNLSECTREDATATNLHYWSERLESWGHFVFIFLIVIGIFSTVIDTYTVAQADEEMALVTCFSSIIEWGLYAFLEYCAYHVLALLISALASITQNTIITANVSLYDAYQKHIVPTTTTEAAPPKMWVCKSCGTQNKDDYGQCKKCGKFRNS